MLCPINKENCQVVNDVENKAALEELPPGYRERCINCLALVICQRNRVEVKPLDRQSLFERLSAGLLQMT